MKLVVDVGFRVGIQPDIVDLIDSLLFGDLEDNNDATLRPGSSYTGYIVEQSTVE